MGIFDSLFGIDRKQYDLPEIPKYKDELEQLKQEEKDRQRAMPCYQVGLTADNRVTLRLANDYNSTLTMNTEGVRHLIRVLEAAIPEYEVPDTVETNEDEGIQSE